MRVFIRIFAGAKVKVTERITLLLTLALALNLFLVTANSAAAAQYQITNLGANTEALSINDSGVIAGNTQLGTGDSPHFGFYTNGAWTDLGKGYANDINNAGVLVGAISRNITPPNDLESMRAYVYNGSFTFPSPAPKNGSLFYGVNEAGSAVGFGSYPFPSGSHAILSQGGTIVDIGAANGWYGSYASAINDSGLIIGDFGLTESSPLNTFLYSNGIVTSLGTLGGSTSYAGAINSSGVVVGGSRLSGDAVQHAYLYQNGTMTDLGSLYGLSSYAFGINDSAQIVGSFYNNSTNTSFAGLWEGASTLDLNTLIDADSGWILKEARDINESGQIVGYGVYNGTMSAFLLTPASVPEPSSLALAFFGLLVGSYAWKTRVKGRGMN